jgi:hypothetical protein
VFATNPADIRHMAPVPAHRQTTLPGDLTLLFRAHGGKPTPAFLGAPALALCPSRPACHLTTVLSAPGLCAPAIAGSALAAPAASLIFLVVVFAHASAAAAGATPGGGLTIGFLGADARGFRVVFTNTLGSTPSAARFGNGEGALIAVWI